MGRSKKHKNKRKRMVYEMLKGSVSEHECDTDGDEVEAAQDEILPTLTAYEIQELATMRDSIEKNIVAVASVLKNEPLIASPTITQDAVWQQAARKFEEYHIRKIRGNAVIEQPCTSSRASSDEQFLKEIQRGVYYYNVNDPPEGTQAYYDAAQNYALFGLTDQNQESNFQVFTTPAACANATFYPHVQQYWINKHSNTGEQEACARTLRLITQNPQLLEASSTISKVKAVQTINNNRVKIKAWQNFCKQAMVVNSALTAAYNQRLHSVNQQTYACRNVLIENHFAALRAAALVNNLQHKPRRVILGRSSNLPHVPN